MKHTQISKVCKNIPSHDIPTPQEMHQIVVSKEDHANIVKKKKNRSLTT